jgi:hypothetical protein
MNSMKKIIASILLIALITNNYSLIYNENNNKKTYICEIDTFNDLA